ncbi:MAG TPA: metalloregulator ArsR/SmtB family transcription factor [Candidatus Limnocylindria bacterium]|nr:metalloregulator ArsR/SmtB family transcription factor [Candidatus Limnocylindria bacterium]
MTFMELPVRTRGVCCDLEVKVDKAKVGETVELLKALADPTRLSMVSVLRQQAGPVCVCDLVAAFDLTQPTISHHMAVLKRAGLVESSKQGIWVYYRLRDELPQGVNKALQVLA